METHYQRFPASLWSPCSGMRLLFSVRFSLAYCAHLCALKTSNKMNFCPTAQLHQLHAMEERLCGIDRGSFLDSRLPGSRSLSADREYVSLRLLAAVPRKCTLCICIQPANQNAAGDESEEGRGCVCSLRRLGSGRRLAKRWGERWALCGRCDTNTRVNPCAGTGAARRFTASRLPRSRSRTGAGGTI